MSLPVIVRPVAEADIRKSREKYEAIRTGLGGQFVARVREILERVEFMPEMYAAIWQDVRAVRLKRFRHVLYYVVLPSHVEVLAVMHGARDAAEWQSRV